MRKVAKFAVSMPEQDFRRLEAVRRRLGKTRSELIREAVRLWAGEENRPGEVGFGMPALPGSVKEESRPYGVKGGLHPSAGKNKAAALPEAEAVGYLVDAAELRRRAIAAAGRFRSRVADLSTEHDKYAGESYEEGRS